MARTPGEPWIGAACEYCGLRWEHGARKKPLRFDLKDDAIVCQRGVGCARRRTEHERVAIVRGRRRKQYWLDGYWYTATQLADLAELPHQCVRERLDQGWCVRDAILPRYDRGHESRSREFKRRITVALLRAGGTPSRVYATDVPGRRSKYGLSFAKIARTVGKSETAVGARIRKLGFNAGLASLVAEARAANDTKRRAA